MGLIASGGITWNLMGSGAVSSGIIASGVITTSMIASGGLGAGSIASGTVTATSLGSGQITSGLLGNASVLSGSIGSGQVSFYHIVSGAFGSIVSGMVTSGSISSGFIGDNAVVSGSIASGQVDTYHFASGSWADNARGLAALHSGAPWTVISEESISGVRAINISPSGGIRIAMASVSGRMPAHGIVTDNVLSGIRVNLRTDGYHQCASGLADYSGSVGRFAYVGRSGQITTVSGSFSSAGFASGDLGQPVGTIVNSGALLFSVGPTAIFSGGPLGKQLGFIDV